MFPSLNRVLIFVLLGVVFSVRSLDRVPLLPLYYLAIQVRKCPATRETNHLFKLNFTLEYYESDLSKVSIKFLGFVFPLKWVSFFRFWPKIRY